jgi:hypothetical protein
MHAVDTDSRQRCKVLKEAHVRFLLLPRTKLCMKSRVFTIQNSEPLFLGLDSSVRI